MFEEPKRSPFVTWKITQLTKSWEKSTGLFRFGVVYFLP